MEKWISRGSKVSLGIYILLAAIGIGYMFWEINVYNHEWTKNYTVTAITVFGTFYIIMLAVEIGFMNRKLTKRHCYWKYHF